MEGHRGKPTHRPTPTRPIIKGMAAAGMACATARAGHTDRGAATRAAHVCHPKRPPPPRARRERPNVRAGQRAGHRAATTTPRHDQAHYGAHVLPPMPRAPRDRDILSSRRTAIHATLRPAPPNPLFCEQCRTALWGRILSEGVFFPPWILNIERRVSVPFSAGRAGGSRQRHLQTQLPHKMKHI